MIDYEDGLDSYFDYAKLHALPPFVSSATYTSLASGTQYNPFSLSEKQLFNQENSDRMILSRLLDNIF